MIFFTKNYGFYRNCVEGNDKIEDEILPGHKLMTIKITKLKCQI